jgi:hypothetical protein
MEYGLRQEIVAGDSTRLRNGLTNAIPSISLVTDLAHLFSPQTGIYVNPGNDGIAWERPVSVELIDPIRGSESEFHIDAGLRIRGAYSRSSSNPKHSFRLLFRSEYGEGKLRFPLVRRRRRVGVRQGGSPHFPKLFVGLREQHRGYLRARDLLARFPARHGHALHPEPVLSSLPQWPVLGPLPNPGTRGRRFRRNLHGR